MLAGLPANGTIAAEVAFMFAEWYRPGAKLEFPKGGSQGIIKALVRRAWCKLRSAAQITRSHESATHSAWHQQDPVICL